MFHNQLFFYENILSPAVRRNYKIFLFYYCNLNHFVFTAAGGFETFLYCFPPTGGMIKTFSYSCKPLFLSPPPTGGLYNPPLIFKLYFLFPERARTASDLSYSTFTANSCRQNIFNAKAIIFVSLKSVYQVWYY
jgi:hypothetical protein